MNQALVSDDQERLEKLYRPCHEDLMLYCLGKFKDYDLAQDAASETLMKLLEHSAPQEIPNLKAWMLTVARNACLKVISTQKRRDGILNQLGFWLSGEQRSEADDRLTQESIDEIIASVLNEKDLKIWSYEEQGYTEEEIAKFLSISGKTVANRRSMIKKKLKDQLTEFCFAAAWFILTLTNHNL